MEDVARRPETWKVARNPQGLPILFRIFLRLFCAEISAVKKLKIALATKKRGFEKLPRFDFFKTSLISGLSVRLHSHVGRTFLYYVHTPRLHRLICSLRGSMARLFVYKKALRRFDIVVCRIAWDEVRVKRAKHAVYENQRTIAAVKALKEGDITKFGELMNQ